MGGAAIDPRDAELLLLRSQGFTYEELAAAVDVKPTSIGTLLGRAMAHEIGHLLMGRAAHAVRGLMRPRWTRAEVARNVKADWGFDGPDLRAIRARF